MVGAARVLYRAGVAEEKSRSSLENGVCRCCNDDDEDDDDDDGDVRLCSKHTRQSPFLSLVTSPKYQFRGLRSLL